VCAELAAPSLRLFFTVRLKKHGTAGRSALRIIAVVCPLGVTYELFPRDLDSAPHSSSSDAVAKDAPTKEVPAVRSISDACFGSLYALDVLWNIWIARLKTVTKGILICRMTTVFIRSKTLMLWMERPCVWPEYRFCAREVEDPLPVVCQSG